MINATQGLLIGGSAQSVAARKRRLPVEVVFSLMWFVRTAVLCLASDALVLRCVPELDGIKSRSTQDGLQT